MTDEDGDGDGDRDSVDDVREIMARVQVRTGAGGKGKGKAHKSGAASGSPGDELIQPFKPLPEARYPSADTIVAALAGAKPASASGGARGAKPASRDGASASARGKATGNAPSPARDLALIHTLRRGDTLPTAAGGDGSAGAGAESTPSSSPLMRLHATAAAVLEDQQTLLDMLVESVEQNANLLVIDGQLLQQGLAASRGSAGDDYDADAWAAKLEENILKRLAAQNALLEQVKGFRRHLAEEEAVSRQLNEADLRLV